MNSPNSIVIETQGLSKTYKSVQALNSLNLTVGRIRSSFLGREWETTDQLLLGLARPLGLSAVFGYDRATALHPQAGRFILQDPRYYDPDRRQTLPSPLTSSPDQLKLKKG
jgi:hypothetical protein